MKNVLVLFFGLFISSSYFLNAQDSIDNQCTTGHDEALQTLKIYLTWDYLEDKRVNVGTNNISVSEVRHVDNPIVCKKITKLINSNIKLKQIAENSEKAKFYYQTNEFYYVFWEEINKNIIMGPKKIFVVINKSTEQIFIDYI